MKAIRWSAFVLTTIFFLQLFSLSPVYAQEISCKTEAEKAVCQAQLAEIEAEQKQAEADLKTAQGKSASLQKDIAVLSAKIKAEELDIKAKNLLLKTLANDISAKQNRLDDLEESIAKGRETLAQIMRKTNEVSSVTLPELILSQSNVSSFFEDIDTFESMENGLKTTFEQIRNDEATTENEKSVLETKQNATADAKHAIEVEQKNVQSNKKQKDELLGISKSNEKAYSNLLAEKQAKAAKIRAALFSLRDAAAIPFGEALQYATLAYQKTGVRPALILAIITQESSLGKNVGSCYLTNTSTGDGVSAKTGNTISKVMSPTRDVRPFLEILNILGGDYAKTRVSCPQSVGWGGAMGPSQFIPSTWMVIKDKLATMLGLSGMPDPWNPGHSFMATALYLSDRGAVSGSYSSERNAACKYYSGSACSKSSLIASYGNSVMVLADSIQSTMIDPLQGL